MDTLDFSEEEIQEQLAVLGYQNIPTHRLREFKQDLDELIRHGAWRSLTPSPQINTRSQTATSQPSPPAYTKEKVSRCYFESSGEGFYLHAGKADHDRQVNGDYGRQRGCCDSYAQHSVAPKMQLPPGAPSRLQVEPDLEDTRHSPLSDSNTSSPDTQRVRFIKRKVLRKHKGQSLVCDESVYSEDSDHTLHTSAGVQVAIMYKTCTTQWDEESDDDRNSLNSSFWSDGEEEEVEIEGANRSKPLHDADDSLQESSEEEKPELNNQGDFTGESAGDEEEDDDTESCSSSSESPAPSLMTSGYGTYRPEEQEGGDYRDDHTITEFDQDSQGDLSEMRDDEEDNRSLGSFGEFDIEPTNEPDLNQTALCVLKDNKVVVNVACCRGSRPQEETSVTGMKPEEEEERADEKYEEENEVTDAASEKQQRHAVETEDTFLLEEKHLQDERDFREEEVQNHHEDREECEDSDESSSNKDIKFIDSKADFSWMTCDKMCDEWEGNLGQKKDAASCLEEGLADLHLNASAQQDFEMKSEDGADRSDIQSAFESYIRGMTGTQSNGDLRPKPKSFIRPVMSQQTIKKTDPVTKYFQYKQLWEMFKLPGETDRRALRCEIKERLAYQPPPAKPRRVYVPNTYTVPTEKKRAALRWEVRNDLANGLLPRKYRYGF